jgi:hypothetical protein
VRRCVAAAAALLAASCGCRGHDRAGAGGDGGAPQAGGGQGPQPAQVGAAAGGEAGVRLEWGPDRISDAERGASGLAASLGVGQVALVWLEDGDPGTDVHFSTISSGSASGPVAVTRDASAYPPAAVEWTGREFAVAWGDDRYRHVEIFVARVSAGGKVVSKPRRFTKTTPSREALDHVYAADSSQNPTLAYYGGQLIMAWGGPGRAGSQQVYLTTISGAGKPLYDPVPVTAGITDALRMRLESKDEGALLSYCVHGSGGFDLYSLELSGSPPEPTQPRRLATSGYTPCSVAHAVAGEGSIAFWVRRDEDEAGAIEDRVAGQVLDAAGGFVGPGLVLDGVRLVKFPGRHCSPFDVIGVGGGRVAVAWVHREHDGGSSLRVGLFDAAGSPVDAGLTIPAQADPTDPHVLPGGQPDSYVLAWLDRPVGMRGHRVYAAGLALGP